AERLVGALAEAVKLQVDLEVALAGAQAAYELLVLGEAHAVGVDHHGPDALRFGQRHDLQVLRMDRRLAPAELHDGGVSTSEPHSTTGTISGTHYGDASNNAHDRIDKVHCQQTIADIPRFSVEQTDEPRDKLDDVEPHRGPAYCTRHIDSSIEGPGCQPE